MHLLLLVGSLLDQVNNGAGRDEGDHREHEEGKGVVGDVLHQRLAHHLGICAADWMAEGGDPESGEQC